LDPAQLVSDQSTIPGGKRASLVSARLMADGAAAARGPSSALDMIIAAITEANDRIVVTDNEKDFAG
jgi:predicted nucleic acid-binding protein